MEISAAAAGTLRGEGESAIGRAQGIPPFGRGMERGDPSMTKKIGVRGMVWNCLLGKVSTMANAHMKHSDQHGPFLGAPAISRCSHHKQRLAQLCEESLLLIIMRCDGAYRVFGFDEVVRAMVKNSPKELSTKCENPTISTLMLGALQCGNRASASVMPTKVSQLAQFHGKRAAKNQTLPKSTGARICLQGNVGFP